MIGTEPIFLELLALHLGRELGGMSLAELRREVDAGSRMTVSVALRRFRQRLGQDEGLKKQVGKATKELGRASST